MFDDFTHHAYQLAFFIDPGVIAADEFSVACRKKLDIGSFAPQFLPSFPGMPEEIPRLQIQSDSGYSVSLSGVRIDLIIDLAYGLNDDDRAKFQRNAQAIIEIADGLGASFVRVGLAQRYFKIMERPAQFISSLYGGNFRDDLIDFGVNSVIRAEFQSRKCNSVFNISAGQIRGVEEGVVAFRDLNIMLGERALNSQEASEFMVFAESSTRADSMKLFVGE